MEATRTLLNISMFYPTCGYGVRNMKIATFNANSIRMRVPILLDWIQSESPDLLAIQETKVENGSFPFSEFERLGYEIAIHGQKARSGVAFLSKKKMENLQMDFQDEHFPPDCRLIAGDYCGIRFVNTYVPNGTEVGSEKFEYKLNWMARLRKFFDETCDKEQPVVWLGDINVARKPDDVFESKKHFGKIGHHPDEFAALDEVTDWGFVDVFRKFHEGPGHYTFWDYRVPNSVARNLGWRIDLIYANEPLASKFQSCVIDLKPRLKEKPSDHTFLIAEFET